MVSAGVAPNETIGALPWIGFWSWRKSQAFAVPPPWAGGPGSHPQANQQCIVGVEVDRRRCRLPLAANGRHNRRMASSSHGVLQQASGLVAVTGVGIMALLASEPPCGVECRPPCCRVVSAASEASAVPYSSTACRLRSLGVGVGSPAINAVTIRGPNQLCFYSDFRDRRNSDIVEWRLPCNPGTRFSNPFRENTSSECRTPVYPPN